MRYDAAVVGCGAAGLAALARLSRAGLRAVGLEAAERVGGRVCTVQLGGAVELGAEWIHGERDNAVYELARRRGVRLARDELEWDVRRSDGAPAPDAAELLDYCAAAARSAPPDTRPLGDHVTREFNAHVAATRPELSEEYRRAVLSLAHLISNNYDATDNWNDISLRGSAQFEELDGHMHWSFGAAGYETLLQLLQEDAGPLDIKLNKEVVQISARGDHSVVRCAGGEEYEARAVLVTVSLGVLKERHKSLFDPPLPAAKVKAIETISMGVMDKICLQYERPWWPRTKKFFGFLWRDDDRCKVEEWMTKILGFSVATGAPAVITLWTSGETAKQVEVMEEERVLRGCRRLLQMFLGAEVAVPEPVAVVRSTWFSSRLTRGSYTYRGRACDAAPDVWAELAAPVCAPLLCFAGEACSERRYSTVHAAALIVEGAARRDSARSKI